MSLIAPMAAVNPAKQDGGRGGIRTHGGFPHARFRVECLKPDSATLPQWQKNSEPAYAESFGVASAQRPTSNIECNHVRCWTLSVGRWMFRLSRQKRILLQAWRPRCCGKKMLQFYACHACARGCILYIQPDSHAITCCLLLLTGCWRRCTPVFAPYSKP